MSIPELLSQIPDESDRHVLARIINRYYVLQLRLSERQLNHARAVELEAKEKDLAEKVTKYENLYQANKKWKAENEERFRQLRSLVDTLNKVNGELDRENETLRTRNAELEVLSKRLLHRIPPQNEVLYQEAGKGEDD